MLTGFGAALDDPKAKPASLAELRAAIAKVMG